MSLPINAALSARLQLLGLTVQFENAPGIKPDPAACYLQESFLPGETRTVGMAITSSNDHIGIYQVMVLAPRETTKGPGREVASQVVGHFPKGLVLAGTGGERITILMASEGPGMPSGDRWAIPITIRYRAFAR